MARTSKSTSKSTNETAAPAIDPAILAMINAAVASALAAQAPAKEPAKPAKATKPAKASPAKEEKPAKPLSLYGQTVEAAVIAAGGDPAKAYRELITRVPTIAKCSREKIMRHIEKAKQHLAI